MPEHPVRDTSLTVGIGSLLAAAVAIGVVLDARMSDVRDETIRLRENVDALQAEITEHAKVVDRLTDYVVRLSNPSLSNSMSSPPTNSRPAPIYRPDIQ